MIGLVIPSMIQPASAMGDPATLPEGSDLHDFSQFSAMLLAQLDPLAMQAPEAEPAASPADTGKDLPPGTGRILPDGALEAVTLVPMPARLDQPAPVDAQPPADRLALLVPPAFPVAMPRADASARLAAATLKQGSGEAPSAQPAMAGPPGASPTALLTPLPVPAVPAGPSVSAGGLTPMPSAESPGGVRPDLEAVVERLADARDAGRAGRAELVLPHREFGQVAIQFQQAGQTLRVLLASSDPEFLPAAQAALAERSITPVNESTRAEHQHAQGQQYQQPQGQAHSGPGSQQGQFGQGAAARSAVGPGEPAGDTPAGDQLGHAGQPRGLFA